MRYLGGTLEKGSHKEDTILNADHWEVSDEQVMEMTGKSIAHWTEVLNQFDAGKKRSNDVVAHLKNKHRVSGNWARTLTTGYLERQS
jgi:hypothetical protein